MNKRRSILGSSLSSAFIVGIILLTIFGLLAEEESILAILAASLLQIVTVVAAFAVLVGVLNLLIFVHLRRMLRGERGGLYSFALILSATLVIGVYSADRSEVWEGELKGQELSPILFRVTQITLESALAGLVLLSLVYAGYRMMRNGANLGALLFIGALLVALLGWLPLDGMESLADARNWLLQIPVTAGVRGLLIGAALGTVAMGIRILLVQERFYQRRQ